MFKLMRKRLRTNILNYISEDSTDQFKELLTAIDKDHHTRNQPAVMPPVPTEATETTRHRESTSTSQELKTVSVLYLQTLTALFPGRMQTIRTKLK